MAETYMGLPVGQTVTVAGWDELPESVRVQRLGVGNRLNGTAWTLAELQAIQNMTEQQMIEAGYLPLNDAQKKSFLEDAQNVKSYYVDPQTQTVSISQANRGNFAEYTTTSGSRLEPGQVGRTNKQFQKYWGSAGNVAWGLTPTGEIIQTNEPTTGNESLDEFIQKAAAGLTTETGTIQGFGGRVFHFDRFGNYFESTGDQTASLAGQRALMGTTGLNAGGQFSNAFTGQRGTSVPSDISRGTGAGRPTYISPTAATTVTTPTAITATTGVVQNPFTPGTEAAKAWDQRKSAYDILFAEFNRYGLGSLVEPLKGMIQQNVSPSEFALQLRDTDAYRMRFAGNQARISKGLRALSEAEYIALEDQYQDVMRRYGLPESYYAQTTDPRTGIRVQKGFEQFISGDVSPVELEDRIQTAYNRVINANPEVSIALRTFYPGVTNGDILAYALDPNKALDQIKRKITAAEIGGAAVQAGLTTNESDAEYLARYGITKEQAQAGYRTISGFLPRAQQLSSIYQKQVEGGPYTQASAEREVFGVPGAAEEERKRQRITSLEQAAFAGQSGLTGGALGRERAGSI